mmetsp:Transcript_27872/g.58058  ORF Transcript_27872/g.58058 Transcript_27872/m.58058 type:complete len:407 (+) Transcript_27872:263-1483(+)
MSEQQHAKDENSKLKAAVCVLGLSTVGLLASTIALAVQNNSSSNAAAAPATAEDKTVATLEASGSDNFLVPIDIVPERATAEIATIFDEGTNVCAEKAIKLDNVDCIHMPGPQAGANVTKGFKGLMEVDVVPNTKNYWQSSMCPVNVHWHLGTEHYSVGEYDENGSGPNGNVGVPYRRTLAEGEVQDGFRCHHYDPDDEAYTRPYEWKHCIGMEVGETYEVHWPHSGAGACGTTYQYQTPFYDGVFCNLDMETLQTLAPQDIANAVGVQGQIFTIVNDDTYYYPDLIRGWIVDEEMGMGQDIAMYTGSTTGESRSNEICSSYSPITWQVDRKCHKISASSFDKLCYDMKMQRDDMSDDLYAHGSRELVTPDYVANNQQTRRLTEKHEHDHSHGHSHVRGHQHHQWF